MKAELEQNGWVVVKNVFTKEEALDFRKRAFLSVQDKTIKGDLLSNPYLEHFIYDDRIIKIATELLGAEPVYFGDSA